MQNNPVYHAVTGRRSIPKLAAPAPGPDVLKRMLHAAESAPDHGRLKPWRIYVVKGERLARLGEEFAKASSTFPPEDARRLEKAKAMPLRAPMVIVVTAVLSENKIPEMEQLIAAGVAVQNMQLVAHEAGFGSMWRTGAVAYDPYVRALFGVEDTDQIVGFLYVGTAEEVLEGRSEENLNKGLEERACYWNGPQDLTRYNADN